MNSDDLFQRAERHYAKIVIILLFIYVFFSIFHILCGGIDEDEGWYLYASKSVYEGKIPYSDFSYTQSPLFPYIYGLPQWLFGTSLYIGRITSVIFGIATLLLSIITARRIQGKLASVICGATISLNSFVIHFLTITKTYALTAFFLSASLFLFVSNINKWKKYSLCTVLLCLATGVRLSVVLAIAVLLIYLLVFERENKKYFFLAAGISIITLGLIFLPFFLNDPELFWHNVISFNTARHHTRDFLHIIRFKISGFITLNRFFTFICVSLFSGISLFFLYNYRTLKKAFLYHSTYTYLAGVLFIIFLSHFLSGQPYSHYHIMSIPLMAILTGCIISKCYEKFNSYEGKIIITAIIFSLIWVNFISVLEYGIDTSGRRLPLQEISKVADYIKKHVEPDRPIFTYRTYLSIQSQRDVLPGLEMAEFSYYPEWDTQKARKYHVINDDIAKELIASKEAGAIILTDFDFSMSARFVILNKAKQEKNKMGIINIILKHYYLAMEMDEFGQLKEKVRVYLPIKK